MKLFKKDNWSKWEHIMFVEDFRSGIKTFELLKRTNLDTGLTEYRRVEVSSHVLHLHSALTEEFKKK